MAMPVVTVVVSTKNEEANIRSCLQSIKEQSYQDLEIVVVDNNSRDRTKEIALEFTANVHNLGPERSAQRNYGIRSGSGSYALYLDADMTLARDVLEKCVEMMEKDQGLVGLYIPEKVIGQGFWIKVRRFERSFYDGTVIDAVRFVRRRDFDEIGGFDESLTGTEDWDIDIRMRSHGPVAVAPCELYHNEGHFHLPTYLTKKAYYAKSFEAYVSKWGRNHSTIRKQLGLSYRYLVVYVENGKIWRLLAHPVLTAAMYFLRFCIGVLYVTRRQN
jgi:glycosyltransferase involved in cell wall biosynthesis